MNILHDTSHRISIQIPLGPLVLPSPPSPPPLYHLKVIDATSTLQSADISSRALVAHMVVCWGSQAELEGVLERRASGGARKFVASFSGNTGERW